METKEKEVEVNGLYESPQVEVIEVKVEKGFAASAGGEDGAWG